MSNSIAFNSIRNATNGCIVNGCAIAANGAAFANHDTVAATNGATDNKINPAKNYYSSTQQSRQLTTNGGHHLNKETTKTTTTTAATKQPELAAKIIKQSSIICFDVDSTVIVEEGIDELAEFCGKGDEVARVTKEAMGGAMTFQDALNVRLNIIRPTQKQIADFIKLRPSTLTHNVKRFMAQLKAEGKQIYLISGGFDCLIEPVAKELNIPLSHLYANKLMFYYNGDYAGFDRTQPTSKSGGKAEAIGLIKQQNQSAESPLITMIGDGATDLEAVPPADYFIGFGGNVQRAPVFTKSQYYVTDFAQLM